MIKKLTCRQVCDLLNFYIEGKLTPKLQKGIDEHIKHCPECKKKFEDLYKLLNRFSNNDNFALYSKEKSNLSKDFINNLSAYIDNELNSNENIKIKKMAISNPAARKKLDSLYKFRQLMQSTYKKTKNDIKFDYSKQIIAQIQDTETYTTSYFYKILISFIGLIFAVIAGFIYLYF